MLPVATPPNAVVYGSGKIEIKDMIKAGLVLNLISLIVISFVGVLLVNQVFDNETMQNFMSSIF